jgi:hypothetical protein
MTGSWMHYFGMRGGKALLTMFYNSGDSANDSPSVRIVLFRPVYSSWFLNQKIYMDCEGKSSHRRAGQAKRLRDQLSHEDYRRSNKVFSQCVSNQFFPTPASTSTGTERGSAFFICSTTSVLVLITSSFPTSRTSSSWTCRSIFASSFSLCRPL